jgi:hypothetical protein
MPKPAYTPLDDALAAIAPFGIELGNGNTNHAPMVAEALCALGRPDAVMPWIARYRGRMLPRPTANGRIDSHDWRAALGRRDRFADWAQFFDRELAAGDWRDILDRWVGRLTPGFCAAATHGVIRVGHAVRGIAERGTPWRRRELADALAAWAATWQELPTGVDAAAGGMSPRTAILDVPLVPPGRRRPGNITAGLAVLREFPDFAPVIAMLDVSGPLAPLVAELSEVFAWVYLANARNIPTVIVFIHAITSHAALGNLVPYLSEGTARRLARYAWQSGCALYACYGGGRPLVTNTAASEEDEEALVDRAIATGDEHAIKFTEACLARHAQCPSPVFLAAARHAVEMLGRGRASSM